MMTLGVALLCYGLGSQDFVVVLIGAALPPEPDHQSISEGE